MIVINMLSPDDMMLSVRTTISIDDALYRTVKDRAAKSGRTIGEIIEDSLRRAFAEAPHESNPSLPELPTDGGTGVVAGVDLTSNAALRDVMDAGEPVDALR
ncbi:MAG: CopG family transcriptional regulator [Acidimicrobiales bacterium]